MQVRAVSLSRDAIKEADAERQLDKVLGRGLLDTVEQGVSAPEERSLLGEEVFLAQLHRRALLLNHGFQKRILQIIKRHKVTGFVERRDSADSSKTADMLSADLLIRFTSESSSARRTSIRDTLPTSLQNSNLAQSRLQISSLPAQLGTHATNDQTETLSDNDSHSPQRRGSTISERSWRTTDAAVVLLDCMFADGIGRVAIHQAPVKR